MLVLDGQRRDVRQVLRDGGPTRCARWQVGGVHEAGGGLGFDQDAERRWNVEQLSGVVAGSSQGLSEREVVVEGAVDDVQLRRCRLVEAGMEVGIGEPAPWAGSGSAPS